MRVRWVRRSAAFSLMAGERGSACDRQVPILGKRFPKDKVKCLQVCCRNSFIDGAGCPAYGPLLGKPLSLRSAASAEPPRADQVSDDEACVA
jgi:hypothetical protein